MHLLVLYISFLCAIVRFSLSNSDCFVYQQTFEITEASAGTYPVQLVFDTATPISQSKMQPSCSDVRFRQAGDTAWLDHWFETPCPLPDTKVWITPTFPGTSNVSIIELFYHCVNDEGVEIAVPGPDPTIVWEGHFWVMKDVDTCTGNWTHDPSLDDFRFLRVNNGVTIANVSGTYPETHTHTMSSSISTSAGSFSRDVTSGVLSIADVNHTHAFDTLIVEAAQPTASPPFLDLYMCKGKYLLPDVGQIFPLTGDWTPSPVDGSFCQDERYDSLDGRFPRAAPSSGSSGGSETHNHVLLGTTDIPSVATPTSLDPIGTDLVAGPMHTHQMTTDLTLSSVSNNPQFWEVVYSRIVSCSSPLSGIRNDVAVFVSHLPPIGFVPVSDYHQHFLRGALIRGMASQLRQPHIHSNSSVSLDVTTNSDVVNTTISTDARTNTDDHVHTPSEFLTGTDESNQNDLHRVEMPIVTYVSNRFRDGVWNRTGEVQIRNLTSTAPEFANLELALVGGTVGLVLVMLCLIAVCALFEMQRKKKEKEKKNDGAALSMDDTIVSVKGTTVPKDDAERLRKDVPKPSNVKPEAEIVTDDEKEQERRRRKEKRRRDAGLRRKRLHREERERKLAEEKAERIQRDRAEAKRKEQEEADRIQREQEKAEQREQEEAERIQREQEEAKEAASLRKEADRIQREQERLRIELREAERFEEEQEEAERIQREQEESESERLRKEQEEAERIQREQEEAEAERLRKEQEAERIQRELKEAEEAERLRKEREEAAAEAEAERLRKQKEAEEEEERERKRKEEEEARRLQEEALSSSAEPTLPLAEPQEDVEESVSSADATGETSSYEYSAEEQAEYAQAYYAAQAQAQEGYGGEYAAAEGYYGAEGYSSGYAEEGAYAEGAAEAGYYAEGGYAEGGYAEGGYAEGGEGYGVEQEEKQEE